MTARSAGISAGPQGTAHLQALQGARSLCLVFDCYGPRQTSPSLHLCNAGKDFAQKSPETDVFRGVTAVHIFTRNHTTTGCAKSKTPAPGCPKSNSSSLVWAGLDKDCSPMTMIQQSQTAAPHMSHRGTAHAPLKCMVPGCILQRGW